MQFVIETSRDDNTGLECWLVVDTFNDCVVDRAFDRADADDICDYYNDMANDPYDIPDVSEYDEWMDFDPDC